MQRCILILQVSHCPSLPSLPLPSTQEEKGRKIKKTKELHESVISEIHLMPRKKKYIYIYIYI